MRVAYKIILTKADDGYSVYVPDFDCYTQGNDVADALYMARDVIGIMGITKEDLGKEIPEPNSGSYELNDGDTELYVDVDFVEYRKRNDNKKVKKTLTIPSWLNKEAEEAQVNFSRVLEEALIDKLQVKRI